MSIIEERDQRIKQWIDEAVSDIDEALKGELQVEEKSAWNDLVTNIDKKIEKEFTEKIREHYPDDRIMGEEGFGDDLKDLEGTVWFIDPIDGTLNFVLQQEKYAIMIAVYENGLGKQGYIYDAMNKKLYHAIKDKGAYCNDQKMEKKANKSLSEGLIASNSLLMTKEEFEENRKIAQQSMGIRMLGSAGLEILEVAKGNTVAYMASTLKPWDIAPGKVILEELGGIATQFSGEAVDLLNQNRMIFATPKAHEEILTNLNQK